jgi:hypothetical protein
VDLVGKGGHIRTVPVPDWVKQTSDEWALSGGNCERKGFSVRLPSWKDLGRRHDGESRVASRQGVCR